MTRKPRGIALAVGASAMILFGVAAVLHDGSPVRPPPRGATVVPRRESRCDVPPSPAARGRERHQEGVRPAPESSTVDPEVERIYREYRVALSTHDRAVEDALYPVLLARREDALGAARRDAAEASSPEEREWAERAVRFLSDPPVPPQYRRPRRDP